MKTSDKNQIIETTWSHFFSDAQKQRGDSIVSVMMAVAITAVVAAGVSGGVSYVLQSQKLVQNTQAMNKFQESLRSTIATVVRDFAKNSCDNNSNKDAPDCSAINMTNPKIKAICVADAVNPADDSVAGPSNGGGSGVPGGGGGAPAIATTPYKSVFASKYLTMTDSGATLEYTNSVANLDSGAPQDLKDAAARCAQPEHKKSFTAGSITGEYFRLCLKVNRPSGTSATSKKDSFWANQTSGTMDTFVEVMFVPIELPTDKPLLCSAFSASNQNGIKVLYTVWWVKPEKMLNKSKTAKYSPTDYHRQNGIFYITKN